MNVVNSFSDLLQKKVLLNKNANSKHKMPLGVLFSLALGKSQSLNLSYSQSNFSNDLLRNQTD